MIPIFNVGQIRDADSRTLERQRISSWQLMERAAEACLPYLVRHGVRTGGGSGTGRKKRVHVFCSRGNNGGDGFALARMLRSAGFGVCVWMPDKEGGWSPDAETNYAKWVSTGGELRILGRTCQGISFPQTSATDILVDALVGTGLKGPLDEATAQAVECFNRCAGIKYSIDIPSGLFADEPTPADAVVVRNSFCLSFQFPKKAFLMPESGNRPYDFAVLDIGLDPEYRENTVADAYCLEVADLQFLLKARPKFSHKGSFGKTALVAGEEGMCGAAVLATGAAIRAGSGLVKVFSSGRNREILQVSVPEAVYADWDSSGPERWMGFDALAFGPGAGTGEKSRKRLREILCFADCPLVIDADGLNLLSQDRTLLEFLPYGRTVLTPHLKEFERLVGPCSDSRERWSRQQEFSDRYGAIVVLKGAHSAITLPGKKKEMPLLFNSTGNPGMATGGSGDVLTGVILALLGQGFTPYQSAYAGVFLHGLAGDLAVEELGEYSLKAGDLVEYLPAAFLYLKGTDCKNIVRGGRRLCRPFGNFPVWNV